MSCSWRVDAFERRLSGLALATRRQGNEKGDCRFGPALGCVCALSQGLRAKYLALALQAVHSKHLLSSKHFGPHCTSLSVPGARARALSVWFIACASLSPLHDPLAPDSPVAQIYPLTRRCETGDVTTQ